MRANDSSVRARPSLAPALGGVAYLTWTTPPGVGPTQLLGLPLTEMSIPVTFAPLPTTTGVAVA